MWKKHPPVSKKRVSDSGDPEDSKVIRTVKRQRQNVSVRENFLKGMVHLIKPDSKAFNLHTSKHVVSMKCLLTMICDQYQWINGNFFCFWVVHQAEFSCQICRKVMVYPITTPCAYNFCKACLEGAFAGQSFTRQRGQGRRTLRVQQNVMKCPSCIIDIADFLQNPQVTHAF